MGKSNPGLTAEQAEVLFNLKHNGVLVRIDERGQRCGDLYQWGLHPRHAELGSPLASADAAFAAAYPLTLAGPQAVTEHALFPAMSAAESLNTAGILVARRRSHRQPHVAEVLQLCRVAMESAALTIWLLGDPDRSVRRDRSMSEKNGAAGTATPVFRDPRAGRDQSQQPLPPAAPRLNAEHRRKYNDMLDQAKAAYTFSKTPSFTAMIRSSVQLVDTHVPAHDTGEIAANGVEGTASPSTPTAPASSTATSG